MHALASEYSIIHSGEISTASYINQMGLSQNGISLLAEQLLDNCFRCFEENNTHVLIRELSDHPDTKCIHYYKSQWSKFFTHIPAVRATLLGEHSQQKLDRLKSNNEISTAFMLSSVVLSTALQKGYNKGIILSENDSQIYALTPETIVLNLLAEVDEECAEFPRLASTRVVKALCLDFFEKLCAGSPRSSYEVNSPLRSSLMWVTQFQGKLNLPERVEKSKHRIIDINKSEEHPKPWKNAMMNFIAPGNASRNLQMGNLLMCVPIPM